MEEIVFWILIKTDETKTYVRVQFVAHQLNLQRTR